MKNFVWAFKYTEHKRAEGFYIVSLHETEAGAVEAMERDERECSGRADPNEARTIEKIEVLP